MLMVLTQMVPIGAKKLSEASSAEFVSVAELLQPSGVICFYERGRRTMDLGRGALLWLLGVPLPIILLLALFWHH
jgi:hypothetical protein